MSNSSNIFVLIKGLSGRTETLKVPESVAIQYHLNNGDHLDDHSVIMALLGSIRNYHKNQLDKEGIRALLEALDEEE